MSESSDTISPSSSDMITSGSDNRNTQTLLAWLDMTNDREERHFLETHPELLTTETGYECILNELIENSPPDKIRSLRDHLKLLSDVYARGSTVAAIREAYVNVHGGFNLDLPPWLEEVKRQFDELIAFGQAAQTATARVKLLRDALIYAQQDEAPAPEMIASLYCRLSMAWWENEDADQEHAIEAMIDAEKAALQVYIRSRYPYMYAMRQNNLGMAYRNRLRGDESQNIEEAIAHYEAALKVFAFDAYPEDYAMVQRNLGVAYQNRVEGEKGANLEQAIQLNRLALQVYTYDAFPVEWAWVQQNLGIVYYESVEGERQSNLERAITCFEAALRVKTQNSLPKEWAEIEIYLGLIYNERTEGDRSTNQERAIAYYEAALQVYTHDIFPEKWAYVQYRLAQLYDERLTGEQDANQERMIDYYNAALQAYTREVDPERFAAIQRSLGIAYRTRTTGDKRANQEQAIACYEAALQVYSRDAFPVKWASTQEFLGYVYDDRIEGELSANQDQVIGCYNAALQVYTHDAYPKDYARIQKFLGRVYQYRIEGEQRTNLEQAIMCYEAALQVYTCEAFPEKWADLQRSLGFVYGNRVEGDASVNRERKMTSFRAALEVYTREAFPEKWADVQLDLGSVYINRLPGNPFNDIEQAITSYEAALQVYTREAFPKEWASTQKYLGIAYENRVSGKRRVNLEQAMAYYEAALQVYTRDASPTDYAATQTHLGDIYYQRIEGERRTNLEEAIVRYGAALQVHTREAFPDEWAKILNRLGYVYTIRIDGEQEMNVEQAIACFEAALQVYTREAFPEDYAGTQNNLGIAYAHRIKGERRTNLELEIRCHEAALQIFSYDASSDGWVSANNNLGAAFAGRIEGDRQENLEQAIAHYTETLHIRTRDAFPEGYAKVQHNLGNVYKERVKGEREANLEQAATCYKEALQVFTFETFPADHRLVQLNLAETEALRENWGGAHEAYTGARAAEDLLVALGKGVAGRDAILKVGRGFAALDGFALTRLGRVEDAAVAIERGQARGLAEALALNTTDPKCISDDARRACYEEARKAFIKAQEMMNISLSRDLPETERRRILLEYSRVHNETFSTFNNVVAEIRAAQDPVDFLMDALEAPTILQAASCGGDGHALAYLVYPPYTTCGGVVVAGLGRNSRTNTQAHFAVLDLPELTYTFVGDLIEDHLGDDTNPVAGGFVYAQEGEGYRLIRQNWPGDTFHLHADGLHALCVTSGKRSILDEVTQELLAMPALTQIAHRPLTDLSAEDKATLKATIGYHHLQRELQYCLEMLAKVVMRPLATWLLDQGVSSLTLIPCGWLAAFPLTSMPFANGCTVGEVLPMSVAPSARSLLHSEHAETERSAVYALGDPRPAHKELQWGEAEALTLALMARRLNLPGRAKVQERATRSWLTQALSRGYVVDASCHGVFDVDAPLNSALLLAKGQKLPLVDLLSYKVDVRGLRLLILSACQTAIFDSRGARDEVRSLAVGMLQAGAQAVLAALWEVDEKATYLLMVHFAQEWFPRMNQEPPAAALGRAQRWLRTVTNRELREWRCGLSDVEERVHRAARQSDPDARPCADPIYWAGFQIIGW